MDFFIKFLNFESLGKIDNSHLAIADRSKKLANDSRCLKLSQLHSEAVNYLNYLLNLK